jgi:RNA polymerase sigma-70 factor (ECF subfamily)
VGELGYAAEGVCLSSSFSRQILSRERKSLLTAEGDTSLASYWGDLGIDAQDERHQPRAEREIVRGLGAGSAEAWHALYDTHSEAVWRCVARRVGPHGAEVADIVQETFLAAARSARSFDAERGSLWNWLSGIARRQAALHFRRKQTRPESRGALNDDATRAGNALRGISGTSLDRTANDGSRNATEGAAYRDDPVALLIAAETAALVRQALSQLPIDYETLLVGKYMDDLSLSDLARAEDLSPEAVSSKLARARRAFREAYEALAAPANCRQGTLT